MHLRQGVGPEYADVGREIGKITGDKAPAGQTISGWLRRDDPPDTRKNLDALVTYLGLADEWLLDDAKGKAPEPELWKRWELERERQRKRPKGSGMDALRATAEAMERDDAPPPPEPPKSDSDSRQYKNGKRQ